MTPTAIQHLKVARWIAHLLDNRFSVLGFRFGLDPVIDLIPGIGTLIPTLLSAYLIWIGMHLNLPNKLLVQMIVNVIIDGILGSIPVVGLIADAFFKANVKNLKILEDFMQVPAEDEPVTRIKT